MSDILEFAEGRRHLTEVEQAIAVLGRFFPMSAADADKQRFVLKRLLAGDALTDAPQYPRTDR